MQNTGDELLRQAVVLDPQFSMAHAELGHRYYLMGDRANRLRGEEHLAKALGLLDRLTPRERLWIQATADDARGNRQSAVEGYRAYLAQYPDDAAGWFRLGWTHMAGLGEYQPAIDAFERAIALRPTDSSSLVNIASCYGGLRKLRRGGRGVSEGVRHRAVARHRTLHQPRVWIHPRQATAISRLQARCSPR